MFKKINFKTPMVMIIGFMLTLMTAVNSPTQSAAFGQRDLSIGTMGHDVIQLQKKLDAAGYETGAADGIYAMKTAQAVEKWQKSKGLSATGKMDAKSIKVMLTIAKAKEKEKEKENYRRVMISENEMKILAQAVYGEARGESLEGQVAVAAVIINRAQSNKFPKTVKGVVYEPWAFTAVHDGQFYMQPDKRSYKAVQMAVKGWDPTGGALYYWNPQTAESEWIWSRPVIKQIGKHVFAK